MTSYAESRMLRVEEFRRNTQAVEALFCRTTGGILSLIQRGGARVGRGFWSSHGATWPFATFCVGRDAITVRLSETEYRLPHAQVRRVKLIGPVWMPLGFHGVVVVHDSSKVPRYVLFWSFNRKALLQALRDEGYSTATG